MKGFATSPSNFTSGLRPRRFFAATTRRLKMDLMLGKKQKKTPVVSTSEVANAA